MEEVVSVYAAVHSYNFETALKWLDCFMQRDENTHPTKKKRLEKWPPLREKGPVVNSFGLAGGNCSPKQEFAAGNEWTTLLR